jgi:hypothetical protein
MHAPLSPAYRVEWRAFPALESSGGQWRVLADRALEPNVFYERPFALNAAPVFGTDAGALLVWSKLGRLMGLFPVRRERWRGGFGPALVGWTHPYAPLGTPLVDREEAEAVIAAWLDHLAADPAMPPLLFLPLIPERGPFATALDAVLNRAGYPNAALSRHQRALLDPGAQRSGYLDRVMSSGRRKELRRQRRRLQDMAPVTFATASATKDIGAALEDFLLLEASGWKALAGTAAVNDASTRSFMEVAVIALASEGKARIDRIFLNGRAIAAAVTLLSGDTAWCWKIAYNEGLARSSPGVQLMLDLTEALLADTAIARVDSCATANHPMIDHIWRERLALCDRMIGLKRSAWPFAVTYGFEALRRTGINFAKTVRDRSR